MPLWAQVSADLRRRCSSGAFEDGVPGELALCEEYGVSRHTVREALRALRSEGLISSSRGRPSTVHSDFSQSLGSVYSLFRSVESQGAIQTSQIVRLESTVDPSRCPATMCQVGDQRQTEDLQTHGSRDDRLQCGAHPDKTAADRADHLDLRGGLVHRPSELGVDRFGQ